VQLLKQLEPIHIGVEVTGLFYPVDREPWMDPSGCVRACVRAAALAAPHRPIRHALCARCCMTGLCRRRLAATCREWGNRRADLLAPIVRQGIKVLTLVIDLCSTVERHDFASNNDTSHWDGLCKFTFAFLLALCVENNLQLLIQSGEVRERLCNLYCAKGLREHELPPHSALVARSFTVPIVVRSIGDEAVQLAVHAVNHPSSWLTYKETVAILRHEVCTPPATPRHGIARLRAPGLVGLSPGFLCRPSCCRSACRSSSGACSTVCATLS